MILLKFLRWLIKIDGFNHVVILPFYLFIHMNDLSLVNLMTVVPKLTKHNQSTGQQPLCWNPKTPEQLYKQGFKMAMAWRQIITNTKRAVSIPTQQAISTPGFSRFFSKSSSRYIGNISFNWFFSFQCNP